MIGLVPIVGIAEISHVNKLALEGGPELPSTTFQGFTYKCHPWIQEDLYMDCEGLKDPSSQSEKTHFEEETLLEYTVTQEQPVRRLTRAYARSLSQLPSFSHYL